MLDYPTPNDKVSVYSDFTMVNTNLYNFTLIFGIVEKPRGEEEEKVFELGRIKMSPETAKQFCKMLENSIKTYESVYGKINEYTKEVARREMELNEKLRMERERLAQTYKKENVQSENNKADS